MSTELEGLQTGLLLSEQFDKDMKTLRSKKRIREADREDFFELFRYVLGPLPRDMFSGCCMTRDSVHDYWTPAENQLERVKSEAHQREIDKICRYPISYFKAHYMEFENQQTKKLIAEIPLWDGFDRIRDIADAITLDGSQNFHPDCLYHYLCGWLAGIFRKLKNPHYQNPVLIFKGSQGIGKDHLIDALTAGFEQWSKHLTLTNNDRDNYQQLGMAAVLKIGEFERSARTDLATLKDMIFRASTHLRESHQPKFKDSPCYASFIASSNADDIYRDPTGQRRFAVFNLAAIAWGYPDSMESSKQILAQAKGLAAEGYEVPQMHKDSMRHFLDSKTPESSEDVAAEVWAAVTSAWLLGLSDFELKTTVRTRGWITNDEAIQAGLFDDCCKRCGVKLQQFRRLLTTAGLSRKKRLVRGFDITCGYSLQEGTAVANAVAFDDSLDNY
jgi:hypothetical protein